MARAKLAARRFIMRRVARRAVDAHGRATPTGVDPAPGSGSTAPDQPGAESGEQDNGADHVHQEHEGQNLAHVGLQLERRGDPCRHPAAARVTPVSATAAPAVASVFSQAAAKSSPSARCRRSRP